VRAFHPLHELPLLIAADRSGAALELGPIGSPFGLAGKDGETSHVSSPIEGVDGIANHEKGTAVAVDLHVEDADGTHGIVQVSSFFQKRKKESVHVCNKMLAFCIKRTERPALV